MVSSYIYGLTDPRTGLIRYVGKTDHPRLRLRAHIEDALATYADTPKKVWIRELMVDAHQAPTMVILEDAVGNWRKREQWWIAFGKRLGWPLTNSTAGGDGPPDDS